MRLSQIDQSQYSNGISKRRAHSLTVTICSLSWTSFLVLLAIIIFCPTTTTITNPHQNHQKQKVPFFFVGVFDVHLISLIRFFPLDYVNVNAIASVQNRKSNTIAFVCQHRWRARDMNHFFIYFNFFRFLELKITHQPNAEILLYQNLTYTEQRSSFFLFLLFFYNVSLSFLLYFFSFSSFYFVVVILWILLFT